jgi:integrase
MDRRWIEENPAKKLKPANEDAPTVDYFHPEEIRKLLDACFTSHTWERGRDFEYRDRRLHALLLFLRWTGLSIIDCIRFERYRLQQNQDGVWSVLLHRQKNGNPVFVAVPPQVADALLEIPPISDTYFFWSGNGKASTAVRGWRRSLTHVFNEAKLKRNNRLIRCHPHMLRHTFAIEKLLAGASLEDVSLLLAHRSIKITERHYLKFDQRRQDRLTKASMVDWNQIETVKSPKTRTSGRGAASASISR